MLDGLTSLSDKAAESLSKHRGYLYLNGLTSLSNTSAESLSKHNGYLYLNGLVSDTALEFLSLHKNQYYYKVFLNGLKNISDSGINKYNINPIFNIIILTNMAIII